MNKEVLKEVKKVIKDIENEFEIEPTEDNRDYLNAKEGFEILIDKLEQLTK